VRRVRERYNRTCLAGAQHEQEGHPAAPAAEPGRAVRRLARAGRRAGCSSCVSGLLLPVEQRLPARGGLLAASAAAEARDLPAVAAPERAYPLPAVHRAHVIAAHRRRHRPPSAATREQRRRTPAPLPPLRRSARASRAAPRRAPAAPVPGGCGRERRRGVSGAAGGAVNMWGNRHVCRAAPADPAHSGARARARGAAMRARGRNGATSRCRGAGRPAVQQTHLLPARRRAVLAPQKRPNSSLHLSSTDAALQGRCALVWRYGARFGRK
jgi:hypothetical protein